MTPTVDLTTERLELTPLTVADADAMVAVYSDELMYTYTGGSAPTLAALRERYQRLHGGWNHDRTERWCNWIVRVKGDSRAIGAMQATIAVDLTWGGGRMGDRRRQTRQRLCLGGGALRGGMAQLGVGREHHGNHLP